MNGFEVNFSVPSFLDLARGDFLADQLGAMNLEELTPFLALLMDAGEQCYVVELLKRWAELDRDASCDLVGVDLIVSTGGGGCLRLKGLGRR